MDKMCIKNMPLVFVGKKVCYGQLNNFGHNFRSKLIQPYYNPGSNLTVLFLTFYSIVSSLGIGKRVQNNFPKVHWENNVCINTHIFIKNIS